MGPYRNGCRRRLHLVSASPAHQAFLHSTARIEVRHVSFRRAPHLNFEFARAYKTYNATAVWQFGPIAIDMLGRSGRVMRTVKRIAGKASCETYWGLGVGGCGILLGGGAGTIRIEHRAGIRQP